MTPTADVAQPPAAALAGEPATAHPPAAAATAYHEAGHAVMAYTLGVRFTEISVIETEDNLGHVGHPLPPDWLRPDLEVGARNRRWIEKRIMVLHAGAESEAAWYRGQPAPPDDWEDRVRTGGYEDLNRAVFRGSYVTGGGTGELEAYLEWLRQRVLSKTGRPLNESERQSGLRDFERRRIEDGDPLFWALVDALAAAVTSAGVLSWHRARAVLRDARDAYLRAGSHGVFGTGYLTSASTARATAGRSRPG